MSSSICTARWGLDSDQSSPSHKIASETIQGDVAAWVQRSGHTEHPTVPCSHVSSWGWTLKRTQLFSGFWVWVSCGEQPAAWNSLSCLSSISQPRISRNNLQNCSCLLTIRAFCRAEFFCWNRVAFSLMPAYYSLLVPAGTLASHL